jgi:hypothetical protein
MAEDTEKSGEAAKPQIAALKSELNKDLKALPMVESPPLSPARREPPVTPESKVEPAASPADDGAPLPLPAAARLRLRPRHKRQAILAASVTISVCIGAIIGALAMSGPSAWSDRAALHEREAMQQSIGKLDKEIGALKAELEAGTKSARSQIAKINDKISERLNRPPETTGSIATVPAAIPTSQPRPEIRTSVVRDWRIYNVRDGIVAVEGHGEIYEIGIGAPLPGLGPVEQIKRQDGRWVVMTPKGLIVSQRDRPYFEPN